MNDRIIVCQGNAFFVDYFYYSVDCFYFSEYKNGQIPADKKEKSKEIIRTLLKKGEIHNSFEAKRCLEELEELEKLEKP